MRFAGFYRQLLGRSSLQAFLPARGVDCGQCDGVKSRPTQLRVRISFGFQDMIRGSGTSLQPTFTGTAHSQPRGPHLRGAPRAPTDVPRGAIVVREQSTIPLAKR